MSRVYLSFLGLGTYKKEKDVFEYNPAVYEIAGKKSAVTEFVQAAEMQILGADKFDKLIIVATQKSFDTHFADLRRQLKNTGAGDIVPVIISEDMSPKGQWEWFERILAHIDHGAELTIDLTHGYRSIPIVFSTAVNFLQKSRDITIDAVYYGAYDKNRKLAPIVDMKEFFTINEWAEAVSRLVEDADARKLAQVAETTSSFQAGELNDPDIIQAFEDLTNTIRNVDVNNVAEKADAALRLVEKKERRASVTGKILLKLVRDKFASLVMSAPLSGKYERPYFRLQLEIIRLLLEHKLYMQAFTVMREFVGSIGMIEVEKAGVNNAKGRARRKMFAEVFVNMFQFQESEWKFHGEAEKAKDRLMPFYNKLKHTGIESRIRDFSKQLSDYRNGFDHAWTLKPGAASDVEEVGSRIYEELKTVFQLLAQKGILS